MNFRNLYFAMAAGLAFTACSSDEPANSGNDNNGQGRFVKVSIIASNGGVDSKAGTQYEDGKFEDGTGAESTVTGKALFIFTNGDGIVSTSEAYVPGWTANGAGTPNIESKAEVQVSITSTDVPSGVIVILNPGTHMADLKVPTTVTGLKAKVCEFAADAKNGNFVMTNSVWNDRWVASISEDNIFKTPEESKNAQPVDIYVERVLSKVNVDLDNITINNSEIDLVDENGVTIEGDNTVTPKVLGAVLSNTTKQAFVIKNLTDINYDWTWVDAANKRSYWEYTSPVSIEMNDNKSFNDIMTSNQTKSFTEYINPNTKVPAANTSLFAPNNHTKLLVIAQLQDNDGNGVSLVQYGANYYTETNFLKYFQAYLETAGVMAVDQEKTETQAGEYSTFRADEFELVKTTVDGGKTYEAMIKAKDSARKVKDEDATTYADCLKSFSRVPFWKDGYTYYFTGIKHQGFVGLDGTGENFLYGVVRNHIYNIDVQSISGLGTPIPNPDDIIDPIKPKDDEKSMIKARISILKWRVVNQTVDLN